MTKADLADLVHEKLKCNKNEAIDCVEHTLEILKEAIAAVGHVKIRGFGNFALRQKSTRTGRNPQTGETITIHHGWF